MNLKIIDKPIAWHLKNLIFIIIGTLISALGINLFIVNANLLSGGVSGIALILQYVFNIPAGYSTLAINIPLLYLSYKKMDLRFTLYTIIATISFSVMLIVTNSLQNIISIDDTLLLSLYGGILNGVGVGIAFTYYGSTGGLDIISSVLKRKNENFNIGTTSFIVNAVIVVIGAFIFGITSALYTLVSIYITAYMIDMVIKGFDRKNKLIFIITEKEKEVSEAIMQNLGRGVTFLYGEGAYTNLERKVLYCVVQLSQVPLLKQMVKEIDENSFISILDVAEVEGKGFRKDSI
ncbi:MAG: YitT family protein [Clostridium lundense]|nr:YitT family protein [Clostridium lundense]